MSYLLVPAIRPASGFQCKTRTTTIFWITSLARVFVVIHLLTFKLIHFANNIWVVVDIAIYFIFVFVVFIIAFFVSDGMIHIKLRVVPSRFLS